MWSTFFILSVMSSRKVIHGEMLNSSLLMIYHQLSSDLLQDKRALDYLVVIPDFLG